jgi:hypothetical protein
VESSSYEEGSWIVRQLSAESDVERRCQESFTVYFISPLTVRIGSSNAFDGL